MRFLYLALAFALCACGKRQPDSAPGIGVEPTVTNSKPSSETTSTPTSSKSSIDWSKLTSKQKFEAMIFTTEAYRKEALRLLIEEANCVARELNLPENLPITETNVLEAYITPPRMAQGMQALGNITTSNYTYYISVGNKFSSLVKQNLQRDYQRFQSEYLWPMSRMDTNAAYQTATQLLAAASIDVNALNRDCKVQIRAFTPEGKTGKHFVPVYWVSWVAAGQEGRGISASIELLLPTRTILQMHVKKSEYILRKPLEIGNLDVLLSQTNAPAVTNAPGLQ